MINSYQPIAPLGIPHIAIEDTVVGGFDIPKGTVLFANIYSSNTDPKYWKDPEKFNPDRFLDGSSTLKKVEAFIPFSAGRNVSS